MQRNCDGQEEYFYWTGGDLCWSDIDGGVTGHPPNDVSPYKCSGTPGPQLNRPLWHNVPGLIHLCHYALYNTFWLVHNDRDVSMQGHCVSGTIHLGDQGTQNIRMRTHRSGRPVTPPYRLPISYCILLNAGHNILCIICSVDMMAFFFLLWSPETIGSNFGSNTS